MTDAETTELTEMNTPPADDLVDMNKTNFSVTESLGIFMLCLAVFASIKYFLRSRKERDDDVYASFLSTQVDA